MFECAEDTRGSQTRVHCPIECSLQNLWKSWRSLDSQMPVQTCWWSYHFCYNSRRHSIFSSLFPQFLYNDLTHVESDVAEVEEAPKKGNVYVPPSMRPGANPLSSSSDRTGRRGIIRDNRVLHTKFYHSDEFATVRVTNLSEDTKEADLQELFRPFGPISRIYLAKDKENNTSRGFAFVSFIRKEDAAKAIEKLSGYGYDHLILHLEWAKYVHYSVRPNGF